MISGKRNIIFGDEFWSKFVQKNWEKKPVHFKNTISSLNQIDKDEVFKWLLAYSNFCRKTNTTVGLKFFINGESQYQNEVLQVLPVKEDKTLLGYHLRMEKLFKDYCLVCDELIQVSGDKWNVLGDFLNGLFQKVGIPNRQAEIGLYLGNYKKTPFGVHVDGCGVFSIPVVGVKKFRLWKPNYVKNNLDLELAYDYKKHLKASELMEAKPSDITYWPSSSWHIAESDGSFSATWSLGVWVDQPYSEVVMQIMQPALSRKINSDANNKLIQFETNTRENGFVKNLPKVLDRSVNKLSRFSKGELRDLFMQHWLQTTSKNGFKSALQSDKAMKLKLSDSIRLIKNSPILWAELSGGNLCLASHGQLMTLKKSKINLKVISDLNSGKLIKIRSLLNKSNQKSELYIILQQLYQMHRVVLAKAIS